MKYLTCEVCGSEDTIIHCTHASFCCGECSSIYWLSAKRAANFNRYDERWEEPILKELKQAR